MADRFAKLKEEFFKLLPPTIYFFITLHIIAVIRVLMTRGTTFPASSTMSIAVASLILGKSVLLADMLPAINLYPEKPLIYNIAWKSTIYLLMSALIHYLERLYDFSKQAGGVVAGNEKLLSEIVWPHFWAIQILLFTLIVAYSTSHELVRYIGGDRAKQIFFGPLPRGPAT